MSATVLGREDWGLERDEEGHRTFKIIHKVQTSSADDGPFVVLNAPGLPVIGALWHFGNDTDLWAFCHPNASITPEVKSEKNKVWHVEQTFSTKPLKRCQDEQYEDPLLEPQKISGGWSKKTKEAVYDRNGDRIETTSHEPIRGHQNEWDDPHATVKVEQNVAALQLETLSSLINHLNDAPLWGMAVRCVKLSNITWERKVHGLCDYYYTRSFEFEIDADTFDRDILDEGTKCLRGHWDKKQYAGSGTGSGTGSGFNPNWGTWVLDNIGGEAPDKSNPSHFIRAVDWDGNVQRVVLDKDGKPAKSVVRVGTGTSGVEVEGVANRVHVEKYEEANLLLLGIPISF